MLILAFSPFAIMTAAFVGWNLIFLYYDFMRRKKNSTPEKPSDLLDDSRTLSQVKLPSLAVKT